MLPKALLRPTHCRDWRCLPTPCRNRAEVCVTHVTRIYHTAKQGWCLTHSAQRLLLLSESGLGNCPTEAAPAAPKAQGAFVYPLMFIGCTAQKQSRARGWNLTVWIGVNCYTRGKQDRVVDNTEALVKCLFIKNRKKNKGCRFPEMAKSFLVLFS